MCSRKRLTFIKDCINNESVCHFMVVQLFKLSTKDNQNKLEFWITVSGSQNRKPKSFRVFAEVTQVKVNNKMTMCHLFRKLSDTFNQNPPHILDKILVKHIPVKKHSQSLTLSPNVKFIENK